MKGVNKLLNNTKKAQYQRDIAQNLDLVMTADILLKNPCVTFQFKPSPTSLAIQNVVINKKINCFDYLSYQCTKKEK